MNKKIPFLIVLITIFFLVGIVIVLVINMQVKDEKPGAVNKPTEWKEYALEEITKDFDSYDFMDRRLVGTKEDGTKEIIVSSIKDLMGEVDTTDWLMYHPSEVSFPPHSSKIFFAKRGHKDIFLWEDSFSGFFMLDVNNLEIKELTSISPIYENSNYHHIISPDGLKIASCGIHDIYLLDFINDNVLSLKESEKKESYCDGKTSEFSWLDNETIQFPVYLNDPPMFEFIELRQINIKGDK